MMKKIRRNIKIVNGKVEDHEYPHDFHLFFEEDILIVKVIMPGIIAKSILVNFIDQKLEIKAFVVNKFRDIFKTTQIHISGQLPVKVIPNILKSSYSRGILSLQLVPSDNDYE